MSLRNGSSSAGKLSLKLHLKAYEVGDIKDTVLSLNTRPPSKKERSSNKERSRNTHSTAPLLLLEENSVELDARGQEEREREKERERMSADNPNLFGPPVSLSHYERNFHLANNARSLPPMPWQMPSSTQQMHGAHSLSLAQGTGVPMPMLDLDSQYYPNGAGLMNNGSAVNVNQSVIFDPNMLLASSSYAFADGEREAGGGGGGLADLSALEAQGGGLDLQFKISIEELDLWDLLPVHSLSKNSPCVAAACGKWNAVTSVRLCVLICVLTDFLSLSFSLSLSTPIGPVSSRPRLLLD
jgi:hypothetical protein